ncbi:glutathione S-transferase family protein [Nitrincola alkalisediminis]|uniref:glutathione S-transferase family protein n=1 Tax=Nitrincola alkalisediminis TaxID=1366656 RepID=UPI0018771807|nr:glutathione S-transferase [Nitrincola alkalisediminis]
MTDITLYQFPISHYCEKVRWALDLKGLDYKTCNLIPGFHIKRISQLSRSTALPLLVQGEQIIQGSAAILDYLDRLQPPLVQSSESEIQQIQHWESRLDTEVGTAVRVFAYHFLLDRPNILVPWLTTGSPAYKRWLFRLLFPKIAQVMRKKMRINAANADTARQTIESSLGEISEIYRSGRYLAGDHFSRADLTAAALFAPLFMPDGYGIDWGNTRSLPTEMLAWMDKHQSNLNELADIYQRYRHLNLTPLTGASAIT